MDYLARIIPGLITAIMSIMSSASLRDRLYIMKQEHEIMWTSLDDMSRMYKDTPAGDYATKTLSFVKSKYGR